VTDLLRLPDEEQEILSNQVSNYRGELPGWIVARD